MKYCLVSKPCTVVPVCGWNPSAWQFKWKMLSSRFIWYSLWMKDIWCVTSQIKAIGQFALVHEAFLTFRSAHVIIYMKMLSSIQIISSHLFFLFPFWKWGGLRVKTIILTICLLMLLWQQHCHLCQGQTSELYHLWHQYDNLLAHNSHMGVFCHLLTCAAPRLSEDPAFPWQPASKKK